MKIDGGCHCGAISYTATVDPAKMNICHCTDCQKLTGTAFRISIPVPEDQFEITGDPKIYIKTTAESGNHRQQAFCPECGTPIYATSVGDGPKVYGLRVGAITQRRELAPHSQIWHASALPWVPEIEGLATKEKD